MKSKQIRQTFLDFFENKKHQIVPSAPMVIKNDPTLMFTNAGMNQFKEYFLGNSDPKSNRVTDSQKCLRVSGKHNDLEEVGVDTYHHTMFEMLGNWSFGDYFKKEAIAWAWELLTEVYKIDKDCLYVTIFEGDKSENLDRDSEAYDLWKELIAEDRILNGNKADNFWEMGAQGPCGPCSEIHVDIRSKEEKAKVGGASLVNMDHPQVVEIWNLVFIQYNRMANGSLKNLPNQHVDTGMGFERLAMVLQNVKSSYDTDVFTPLIREIETITGHSYGKTTQEDIAIRVIADHVRAVSFSIADGQLPSNNGAGYVIRMILRRAIRYGFTYLNKKEPFIYQLVNTLSKQMGDAFPELKAQKNLILNVIKEEEASFLRTLENGLALLDSMVAGMKNEASKTLDGKKAFELNDTYGFPKELTRLILSEQGLEMDEEGFAIALKKQQDSSREASATETSDWTILREDDTQEFIGYDRLTADVRISKYRKVISKKDGELYQLVFNMTPFYGESGGQTGDKGYLEHTSGDTVYIIDTKKENGQTVHLTKNLPNEISSAFKVTVDVNQRARTASNHTATHLLHQALRKVLGTHVEQKGSMVRSASLRFDFSHFSKVSAEELVEIENFVNARIREQLPLEENRNNTYDQAIEEGAIGLFGEKYGDVVRTIKFGVSQELCGGTHVKNTADIWHFKITSESAIASGIRRIEAISSDAVKDFFTEQSKSFEEIKSILKNPTKNPAESIAALQEENASLKKEIEHLLKAKAGNLKGDLIASAQLINGVNFIATKTDLDAKSVKELAFDIEREMEDLFLIIGADNGDKATLTVILSKNIVEEKGLDAGKIVRELGKHIQGGGGGQAHFATAGGKNPAGIDEALTAAKELV
ncbi:alanine--tRNA ligase [Nonlabens sp. MB-3u-79]|uniref:alanine--tRNA ligase n=1 Tax=Nonlabens sp. MB-3u-79 TaxID=2058134 RepID=UPI000C31B5DE|nr:alanine--tRNA ligase [Nonlabens sp. MB-3u-79]AUC79458.1 alanine--tRNA ligase [Nonlabens sp. MB-3u-79]|tara:strand:+ start:17016 stop:19637 length:2622 start_codon:yes stop_codon:yes gene_type:complete